MSKRKTKEQKILATLKKLQAGQNTPTDLAKPSPSFSYRYEQKTVGLNSSHAYIKKDLVKIIILATLAIGIQIVLSLLRGKLKLPF